MKDTFQITALLHRIRLHDDEQAYKQLFLLLHKPLVRFASGILRSKDDAEEVVSDVFMYIWDKRGQLPELESPLVYFYTAVKNRSLNSLDRIRRQKALDSTEGLFSSESVYFNPEKLMMTEELIQKLRTAINALPGRCKLIFILVKEDGLKYREVAELLEVSVKTVEAQMAIALRRLGKCMHLDIPRHESRTVKK